DEDDEQRGVEDGEAHLAGGGGDDLQAGQGRGAGGVFAQAAEDVFNVHDGVIDDHADGDGEAAEGHGVHGDVEPAKGEQRDREAHGHGHERDRGGAHVEQEEEEHDGDHDGAVADGFLEVADGVVDEVFLLKERERLDAGWERGSEFVEGDFYLFGERAGVEAGGLGDRHDDAVGGRGFGRAAHGGVAAHGLDAPGDLGDIGEGDGAVAGVFDDGAGELGEVGGHGEVAHHDFGRGGLDEAAGGGAGGVGDGGLELGEGGVVGLQAVGVGADLDLADAAAHVEDFGDARDGLQAAADGPVGERADLGGRQVIGVAGRGGGAHADQQDFAHEGGDGRHERLHAGRELFAGGLQAFLHEHAGALNVGVPVEFDVDEREGDVGVGAQAGEPGDAKQGAF